MKFLIEAGPLFRRKSGIGYYTENLVEAMAEEGKSHRFILFGLVFWGRKPPQLLPKSFKNVGFSFIRFFPGKLFNVLIRRAIVPPLDMFLPKSDAILFTNFVTWPMARKTPAVTIIYDLNYIHTDYAFFAEKLYLLRRVQIAIRRSAQIITISQSSKREIMEYYGLTDDKITVAPPAVDGGKFQPRPDLEVAATKNKYSIGPEYILFIGNLEPRKNLNGLMEAYSLLPASLKKRFQLVIAGGKAWNDNELLARLNHLVDAGENILQTGYVDEYDLAALYSGAAVFVFPSHYEGFGMPVLEAMACGTPVITADNTSLPEVAGEAALMVSSTNSKQLSQAIEQVLTDKKLAAKMIKLGLAQAKKFSWTESAKSVVAVLENAGKKK